MDARRVALGCTFALLVTAGCTSGSAATPTGPSPATTSLSPSTVTTSPPDEAPPGY